MTEELCQHIECTESAQYHVRLALRPFRDAEPAYTEPFLSVCEEHKNVQWEDVVDDRGWDTIRTGFRDAGVPEPMKKFSNVDVRLITPKP